VCLNLRNKIKLQSFFISHASFFLVGEIDEVKRVEGLVTDLFRNFTTSVPGFEVLNESYVPDGLNPHTRSVCWLAEQVILQNTRRLPQIHRLVDPPSDISAWDARLFFDGEDETPIFINIKVSSTTKRLKNDIASVKKLKQFYEEYPDALLFFVVIRFDFENTWIRFHKEPIVQYYPWMKGYYINPRNHHIQAHYDCGDEYRTLDQFINEFMSTAREKGLVYN